LDSARSGGAVDARGVSCGCAGQRVKVWVSSNDELSRMYQLLTTAFPSAPGEEFAAAFRIEISHDW
jgi:hypothetical protein